MCEYKDIDVYLGNIEGGGLAGGGKRRGKGGKGEGGRPAYVSTERFFIFASFPAHVL